ncbi:MAG: hypothetical protein ABIH90_02275 [Candidatus Aenigmatarchaeota archaeon]
MAVSQELIDYIKESINSGRTLYEIKYDLANEGWDEIDIENGVREAQGRQPQQYQQPTQQYQQPQQYEQPRQYDQYQQPTQQPYTQPQQPVLRSSPRNPIIGLVLSMVAAVVLFLDATVLKSRSWIDIFNSMNVVDTNVIGIGLLVLLIVFAAGIALGGVISMKRKPLPGGIMVLVLSLLSMLTFSGLISGLVGLVAGFIILLGK